ncbi:MAG: Tyrosine-tRNA ligase [Parcubacteria group bacterium GW2011_GWE2_39_37]|nr:MAG: Tyrosine-tRNA ligase [Parcubacteria group bacterium GW2011_GWE2_39_37]
MIEVITDKARINEVLTRGVENIYPNREFLEKTLASGKRLRIYCGFDPTAPSLHIGHAIQINKLAQLQALGHEIIFLIGGFTGMIGDPTDKTATRKKLTKEEVLINSKNYKKQASAYLKFTGENPAKVMNNSKWFDKMTFSDLIELASNFTVGQMLVRDMFQKRMEEQKPIHLHEFLYPLAQGYDSVVMDVDMEVGGNDQTFNMLAGRDLMKSLLGKEKFVITTKLLADEEGKKMGKTEGNAVSLNETAENVYGKIMSWPDGTIVNAFELCTNEPMSEVEKMREEIKLGKNPRDAKMRLAFEVTKLYHGEKKAKQAENYFIKTVQKKEVPIKLASSKGEARRLIEQGGVKVNGLVVKDVNADLNIVPEGVLLQRGKLHFLKVVGA